jgi:DNA-binding MarR family transcriptional regulator
VVMSQDSTATVGARLAHLPPLGLAAKRLEDGLSVFVDALFERRFGLRRRHWQLLRWTAETPDPRVEAFVASASTFYADAAARRIIDDLVERGWLRRDAADPDPALALTSDGWSGFEDMRAAQEATWSVVLEGLSEADYTATVTAMTAMADNLDRALGRS